jgi:type I restriction enzyme, S subunit
MNENRYKPHQNLKESGMNWLGQIPRHWKLLGGKRLFTNRRSSAGEDDDQLAASQKHGVIPQSRMMQLNDAKVMLALKGTSSFRHVEPEDFVISLRSFEGGIEYSKYRGCVSPAYTVLKGRTQTVPSFFRHFFKSVPFITALQSTTDSLRDGKSITYEQFGPILLPLPPLDEQSQIATFLDYETAKIDTLIEKQEHLIALLREKRQAVISHAVTRGLNPDTPMRDSGIEWLGEIPAHWRTKQIRYVTNQSGGGTPNKDTPEYWGGHIPWVSPKDMKSSYISDSQDRITPEAIANSSTKLNPAGSILVVVRGMILVHSVPVAMTTSEVTINQDMKALLPKNEIDSEYLLYLLQGLRDPILSLVEDSAHGTKRLNSERFGRLELTIPPILEQKSLVRQLKVRLDEIDTLFKSVAQQEDLLNERRTALISAAVTGKIDVRDWQPHQHDTTDGEEAA